MKTSGRFNIDLESDKFNELFSNTSFNLHRLLSTCQDDVNLDDLPNFSSLKSLLSIEPGVCTDSITIDQLISLTNINEVGQPCPSSSCVSAIDGDHHISQTRKTPSPDLITDFFPPSSDPQYNDYQLKIEPHSYMCQPTYAQLNTLESIRIDESPQLLPPPPPPTSLACQPQHFSFDAAALAAIEHDHAFMTKKITESPSKKRYRSRTRTRYESTSSLGSNSLQTSSYNNNNNNSNDDSSSCFNTPNLLPATTASSSDTCTTPRTKRSRTSHIVNRADDVKTEDDLSYYLERRRRNNMASKNSRAARKQKFGDMDYKCDEYKKLNEDLRIKISTLETVTARLKDGLVQSFQTAKIKKT
ncbi:unnamed protein product [Didymodactylos carnosus]|uniref:BZIP domain-containing protein n=1 Tax=Didymodactylos carnosus TaxID=1234261 RepID=A0A813ZUE7_9BILA|nr:unnamed protein product [Didymodactylos carnosus]CAF1391630.1 unnamed protein product [Didymodactylos carnosus]CAF3686305.1 unnamed protein product [Didymodactylos carnosus]CAF4199240.1 unnamed protein product [Didymodactylos carnosus]